MTTVFETERLIVRNWDPDWDVDAAFSIYGDPEVMQFVGAGQPAASLDGVRSQLQKQLNHYADLNNGTGWWAMVKRSTGDPVGSVILRQLPDAAGQLTQDYEVGWHLRREAWGKGYATEAARAAVHYGFRTLELPVLYAVIHPNNQASIRVTQRLGMVPLGRTTQYYGGVELELFELTASTFHRLTAHPL